MRKPAPLSLISDRWARVVWSAVTTPGDRFVHEAVGVLGAQEALQRLWGRAPAAIARLASDVGVDPGEVVDFRRRYPTPPLPEMAAELNSRCRSAGVHVVTPTDPGWPARLADLGPFAPLVLYVLGPAQVMSADATLGVIGSRRPQISGIEACRRIVTTAATAGYTLVSGGAKGIDWAAHEAALAAHQPQVMVLATALDRPASWQRGRLGAIAHHGVVISETPPGLGISASSFLHRNRVIAALSDRVIVVEAAERSGSLNTASHAKTLGRDLSAVVVRPPDASNAGCYRLVEEWGADVYRVTTPRA